MKTKMRGKLRICAHCEWIFKMEKECSGCPRCGFLHYGAHWVYGNKCYEYAKTQEPWKERILTKVSCSLDKIIKKRQTR